MGDGVDFLLNMSLFVYCAIILVLACRFSLRCKHTLLAKQQLAAMQPESQHALTLSRAKHVSPTSSDWRRIAWTSPIVLSLVFLVDFFLLRYLPWLMAWLLKIGFCFLSSVISMSLYNMTIARLGPPPHGQLTTCLPSPLNDLDPGAWACAGVGFVFSLCHVFAPTWVTGQLYLVASTFFLLGVLLMPSARFLATVLGGMTIFDVFWVFISAYILPIPSESVLYLSPCMSVIPLSGEHSEGGAMGFVARTVTATNVPVMLNLPWTHRLGLGDVFLPGPLWLGALSDALRAAGLFLAFIFRFEAQYATNSRTASQDASPRRAPLLPPLFISAMCGYLGGGALTLMALERFGSQVCHFVGFERTTRVVPRDAACPVVPCSINAGRPSHWRRHFQKAICSVVALERIAVLANARFSGQRGDCKRDY